MSERVYWRPPWYLWVAAGAGALALAHARGGSSFAGSGASFTSLVVLVAVTAAAAALWELEPAVTLCAALALTLFSGNWASLGLPGFPFLPDRILVIAVLAALALRAPGAVEAPRVRLRAVHVLLLVTVVYATLSAADVGTLGTKKGLFDLLDLLGVIPYLMLAIAPIVFHGERQRAWLLATLVGIGVYLGVTAVLEAVGPHSLVFPGYILEADTASGGRAGGPFRASDTEGFATFACAIAALIAFMRWSGRARRALALSTALACTLGCFLTLERGAWIGAALGFAVLGLSLRELRRFAVPALALGAVAIVSLLALSPTLANRTSERAKDQLSVWDRENMTAAGLRMIEAKPLFGFGWDNYENANEDYFRQAATYPLTGLNTTVGEQKVPLHDTYLAFGVDLGIVGGLLWLAALLWGVGGAALAHGPPELRLWKAGLGAVFACYLVLALVDPLSQSFTQLLLWTWAGVCMAGASRRGGAPLLAAARAR